MLYLFRPVFLVSMANWVVMRAACFFFFFAFFSHLRDVGMLWASEREADLRKLDSLIV